MLKKVYQSGVTSKIGNPSEAENNITKEIQNDKVNQSQFQKPPIQPNSKTNKSIEIQSQNNKDLITKLNLMNLNRGSSNSIDYDNQQNKYATLASKKAINFIN